MSCKIKYGEKSTTLLVFLFIFTNMLNYLDRGYLSGINKQLMNNFNITNTESGVLSSSFMGGYIISSVIFSY